MKITRIVNGQEMEFELTDSELRAVLVNTLFSPEKDGVLAEEAGELFSEALFNMDEEMACAVSPSEYTTTELVGTRITERLQDTLAEAAQEYADRYKAIVEWAERHDEATIHANIKAVQRRYVEGESLFTMRHGKIAQGQNVNDEDYFEDSFFCDRAGKPVDGTSGDYRHEARRITRMKRRDMTALH